ncbi:MAG: beta-ketoacyl-[acyl-carrier-protein] synthase II [Micavibrio aeruginosavorus]|uniref:3-oxoacyl-[acyl-carrier-protein] synthase 2 n=1 Tax=Micavibrio aeruginosavorus TaxID=349221 RepID=A0A2W5N3Y3_9BACT|nr:MAG: beta-ketoacyl-[acyl-carrier-protein] synthase II [Micavibrio aeruginosavorus]
MRRVVVTGMGMVTPLGVGVKRNWDSITAGKSGIREIDEFDLTDMASRIAGLVPKTKDENPTDGAFNVDLFVEKKEQKKIDQFIMFGMAAAQEAIEDSGWVCKTEEDQHRTGVLIGSGIGGLGTMLETSRTLIEKGPKRMSPFCIPAMLINLASGHVSIKHGFKGPNHSVVTACATGTHAIGDSARMIMLGDADVMVAGGAEAAVTPLGVGGFAAARALSTGYNDRPAEASRPFDEGRDGFVIAEGAGVVILEEYEHAKKRGAKIYAEIIGYGMSGDAYHITSPAENGDGGFRAMTAALKSAGINPEDVDYINAHGTSTPVGDGLECTAIKNRFAGSLDKLSMSSTKSAIGHLLGAAGAVEAIYSIKAIETGVLPPTLNLDNVSEPCKGLDLVPKVAKDKKVKIALSNSFGFGGTNASVIMKAV